MLSQGDKKAYAALAYVPGSSNFTDKDDMPAIVYRDNPLALYSISSASNQPLAINSSGTFDMFPVPLGFRATDAGETKLEFKNWETFGYDVTLIDHVANKRINLAAIPEYTFTIVKNGGAAVEINDRFTLEMVFTGTGITGSEPAVQPPALQVSGGDGYIYIKSTAGAISRLQVYDVVGRIVYSTSNLNETQLKLPVNSKQMYIVKAGIGSETIVGKIKPN
jgi:hypothetical protein